MSLTVGDQVTIALAVDGTDIPVGLSSFSKFEMCENIATKLPTIEFEINDPLNFFSELTQLKDGSIVTGLLHSDCGYDYGQPQSTDYLVQGTSLEIHGNALHYLCNGIYNAPKYLAGNVTKSYKGTSADVLGQLIGECGLTLKAADGTNDSMAWLPSRESYHDFIRNIVDHGHVDDKSIMSHGVTSQGEVIYKNLTTLATQAPSKIIASGSPDMITQGIIPCIKYKVINMAGMSNFTYNYGLKLVQEKMTGLAQDFSSFAATLFNSDGLDLSSSIKDAIGGFVRSEYLPHDFGNTHDNMYQAEYQNRRGKQTFTTKVEVTTLNSSGLNIYDVVEFRPILPTNNQLAEFLVGNYIITAKTKYLAGNQYSERLELASQ